MGLIPDAFNMKLVNNLKVRIQIQSFPSLHLKAALANTARLVGILICIISCCCGIACGLMAMAIAWVYYRPGWLEARSLKYMIIDIFVDVFGFNSSIPLRVIWFFFRNFFDVLSICLLALDTLWPFICISSSCARPLIGIPLLIVSTLIFVAVGYFMYSRRDPSKVPCSSDRKMSAKLTQLLSHQH